jgi:hypothetical protein
MAMNRLLILSFGCWVFLSCTSQKPLVQIEDKATESDSTEYALIITEPGFESWFATNSKPVWYHEENYYKHFNQLYTNEWNHRVRSIQYHPFDAMIEYNYTIEYGKDLEHELYWYFQFMMDKYDFKLLVTDRPK